MKTQALTPLASSYIGDRRLGCACAYLALPPQVLHGKRAERMQQEQTLPTRLHEDVFVTGTGAKSAKFICHRGLTRVHPVATAEPRASCERTSNSFVQRITTAVARAVRRFLVFICPRIQFGMGINLFRLN